MAHNDVGETGLKRSLNLIWDRTFTCFHLQHNFKTKRHSILLVPVNDGLELWFIIFEIKSKNEHGGHFDIANFIWLKMASGAPS